MIRFKGDQNYLAYLWLVSIYVGGVIRNSDFYLVLKHVIIIYPVGI